MPVARCASIAFRALVLLAAGCHGSIQTAANASLAVQQQPEAVTTCIGDGDTDGVSLLQRSVQKATITSQQDGQSLAAKGDCPEFCTENKKMIKKTWTKRCKHKKCTDCQECQGEETTTTNDCQASCEKKFGKKGKEETCQNSKCSGCTECQAGLAPEEWTFGGTGFKCDWEVWDYSGYHPLKDTSPTPLEAKLLGENVDGVEQCKELCAADPECSAISWYEDWYHIQATCYSCPGNGWIKSLGGGEIWWKTSEVPELQYDGHQECPEDKRIELGVHLGSVDGYEECKDLCIEDDECAALNWFPGREGGLCYKCFADGLIGLDRRPIGSNDGVQWRKVVPTPLPTPKPTQVPTPRPTRKPTTPWPTPMPTPEPTYEPYPCTDDEPLLPPPLDVAPANTCEWWKNNAPGGCDWMPDIKKNCCFCNL